VNAQEIIAEIVEQLRGAWRYRWVAMGVAWALSLGGWLYVATMPDIFLASARVYVNTNSLLKPLMQGLTAQQNTMSEVQLVSTAVLSRPNLESVARETNLDLRAKNPDDFEQLITGLKTEIRVSGGRDNIFSIQYQDTSREMARDVVAAVLDTFVEDAIVAQGDDAEITEIALGGEIQDHEQRLSTAEAALAEFKKNNLGYMPGESGDYYARLQTALGNVAQTEEKIRQLQQRRDELNRQLEGEEPVFGIVPTAGDAMCSLRGQIGDLEKQLSGLLVDFTEKHPRVVTLRETIDSLERRCADERVAGVAAGVSRAQASGDTLEMNPVYQNLRIQQSNTELELAEARAQLGSYQNAVAGLRRDVDKIAEVETQLKQLNRDYSVVQSRHQELLKRWEDLQAKKRLDPVTDDVQFRRIEPPFALAEPVGPNRPLFLGATLVFALGAGGALAFVLSQVHPTFFTRRSVRRVSGLPVLGAVTLLQTPAQASRRRMQSIAWAAGCVALLFSTAIVVLYSGAIADLVRAMTGGPPT
jgi:polysaccharide chain length determinant protein (PEP-CTERM system associated)